MLSTDLQNQIAHYCFVNALPATISLLVVALVIVAAVGGVMMRGGATKARLIKVVSILTIAAISGVSYLGYGFTQNNIQDATIVLTHPFSSAYHEDTEDYKLSYQEPDEILHIGSGQVSVHKPNHTIFFTGKQLETIAQKLAATDPDTARKLFATAANK